MYAIRSYYVTLASAASDPTNAAFTVTATFSESVTGFDAGDISVTNGIAGSFSGSGASYSFTVTPSGQGLVSVTIPAGVAQDAATNYNTASNILTRTFDSLPPSVALSSAASDPTNAAFTVTATFSESVSGFVVGDITAGNGSVRITSYNVCYTKLLRGLKRRKMMSICRV